MNTTLSVFASPSVIDPEDPALKFTTPSTVSVPAMSTSPPTSKFPTTYALSFILRACVRWVSVSVIFTLSVPPVLRFIWSVPKLTNLHP